MSFGQQRPVPVVQRQSKYTVQAEILEGLRKEIQIFRNMALSQSQKIKGISTIQDSLTEELQEAKQQLKKAQHNLEKGTEEKRALQQQLTDQKKLLDERLDELELVKAERNQHILL